MRWMGARLGIEDRNSGSFYLLHGPDINDLRAHLDEVVLVEGYVDGPNTVRIVHWISLQRGVSAGSVDTP